jgi:O-antigen/teichoic acid export membrane protein
VGLLNPKATVSVSRKFVRTSLGIIGGRVAGVIAQALLLIVLARQLPPGEFALLATFLGAFGFLSAVCDLGISPALTRATASGDMLARRQMHALALRSSVVCGVVSALGFQLIGLTRPDIEWAMWLWAFGPWLWFDRLADNRVAVMIGKGRAFGIAANGLIRRYIPLVGVVAITLYTPDSGGHSAAALLLLSPLASLVSLTLPSARHDMDRHQESSLSRGDLVAAFRHARPFWLNSTAAQSRQLDLVIVNLLAPTTGAIEYAPVSRLITPLRLLPTSLAQALLATKSGSDGRRVLLAMTMSISLFLACAVAAETLLVRALGETYRGSVPVLQVLLVGLCFAAYSSMRTTQLQKAHLEREVARIAMVSALLSLVLIGAGALIDGAVGAALGLTLGYALQSVALGSLRLSRRVERAT